jgi:tRNA modification GTPase
LRDTTDVVERLGIEVSERYLAGAHVVLACGESDAALAACAAQVAGLTGAPVVEVRTKADLEGQRGAISEERSVGTSALPPGFPRVVVSAETGEGLRALLDLVAAAIEARHGAPDVDAPLVTRERHRRALAEARDEVSAFVAAWSAGALPAVVAAVHVRAAVAALEGLIGVVDVEQVLERVFAAFCVGK